MNQILSVEMPQSKSKSYRRNSNKADIRTIIVFFCIILILFAIIIAIVAFSIMNKKEEKQSQSNQNQVVTGTQPTINVEIQSETTLNIIVTHDKQLSTISYNWNDGENIQETNIGETTKEIQVEIPAGTNTLNVSVTDINGVTQNYSSQHTGVQGPSIILEQQGNDIKLTAQSNITISYISYNWDGGDEKQIQVNDVRTEQIIEVLEGEHTLNIVVVDMEGQETTKTQTIKGDNKPTLKLKRDSNNLYIEASDDEGLTKMSVLVYNGNAQEFEINNKQFNKTLQLRPGDNRFIITVYNVNGIKNEQKVRIVK